MKKSSRSSHPPLSNPKMRSLTTSQAPRGVSSRHPETTENSEISEHEIQEGRDPGVRYITESLIQRLSRQENLAFVISLNLSLSKDGGKKFKFIENLEKCEHLEVLNLSHNLIAKIEKLQRQTRLRELNLAHNRISKIEGLEHLQNLQKLNLSANDIEHLPAWMGKKLKALRILNVKQNGISSLQDVSRLKPLKDLTSLVLADNPVANLPHYRPYVIFHLRSLHSLDGQVITIQERQEAQERFHQEEVEKLERDLEKKVREMEELQSQKKKVVSELHSQDELNTSLRQEAKQHKKSYQELERQMATKDELLKQKTLALSRACHTQYQLEQELAFYKIDAKFEPLGYLTSEAVDAEDAPGESPYIGKARYKRNQYAQEDYIPHRAQQIQVGKVEIDGDDQIKNQQIRARIHTALEVDLNEKQKSIGAAEAKLSDLRQEMVHASEELKDLEEAITQKKVSEAEKEELRQQLQHRIHILNQLRDEAQELEGLMERQRGDMDRKQRDIDGLQRHLHTLSPQDPRHSHVTAQKISAEQQLEMMDTQYKKLEARLDDMLSRITRETEEIRDLEQQLTEGQIAANEALKRDLEGIISGLQEYLESVKGQARQAQEQCRGLQSEREDLRQRVEELEAAVQEAEHTRKEVEDLEEVLQEQQEVNEALQQAQGDGRAYEAQLEAQIRAREAEISQLKEDLEQRARQQHADNSAWKAQLESARSEAQHLQEQDKEREKLLSQVLQLQGENAVLVSQVDGLQTRLRDAVDNLVHPEEISARVSELMRKLQTGAGELRCSGPSDVLGQNLAELQRQIGQILQRSEEEKREAQELQRTLQNEVAALQERVRQVPADYKRACDKAADAKLQLEKRQHEAALQQLEKQVLRLKEKLGTMEGIQDLAEQQLLEAEEERERLLAELRHLEAERRVEGSRAQHQLSGRDHELKELRRAVATSDTMAASELSNTKEQLRSLHGTVLQINRERAEEMQEAENYNSQAARAARDLVKAESEIELLQELLHEKDKQLQDADPGLAVSSWQRQQIQRLDDAVRKQRAEMDRLRHLLEHGRTDNVGGMETLVEEIQSLRRDVTSMADAFHRKGYCYLPASCTISGRDSLSTKDSGVSVHYPMASTPAKRRSCHHGQREAPAARHWEYSPAAAHGHSDGDAEAISDHHVPPSCHFTAPPGSVIYTVFPDGTPVPPGTVIYGPPPSEGRILAPGTVIYGPPPIGSTVVSGPPPPQFTIPVIPAGGLHCNVSVHHNLENELSRLEDIIDHLKLRRQKDKCLKATLEDDVTVLRSQREALRREVEELRDSAKKRKRKNLVDGQVERLITELELERSLQDHNNMEDEIDCIEKTLLKRRVELREADRLLAVAESELKDTRDKALEEVKKHNATKAQLCQAESDAEELERRAQETAVNLVKADQQLRDLEQRRAAQEAVLQEVNRIVAAKDAEFHSVNLKLEAMTESLQKLQEEIRAADEKEAENDQTMREAENLVVEKRTVLDQLHCQISAQQEEAAQLDRILGHKKQELHLLQGHIHQKQVDLKDVLRDGEQEVAERRREIVEVKSILKELSVQKGDLSAQLNEKRSQLSALRQEILEEGDHLQETVSQIHRQKSELKRVVEMQELENNELQGLKLQHEKKISDLEKTQALLLQGKLELENLQRTLQRVRGETERQRQVLEKDHKEMELLMTQMQTLQEKIDVLNTQKENLEESNHELERRFDQSKKALSDMEERGRTASAALERLEAEVRSRQDECCHLSKRKQLLQEEAADAQRALEDRTAELNRLTAKLSDGKEQLRLLEQDVSSATKHRDDILHEMSALQEDMAATAGRHRLLQEKERRADERLRQLHRSVEEKDTQLKQILEEIEGRDRDLRAVAARLEIDRQNYEREVSEQQNAQEERARTLRRSAALEESLHTARRLLSEQEEKLQNKCNEAAALHKEVETHRSDLSRVQDAATSARRRDEQSILTLEETISKQRQQQEELRRENSGLKKRLTTVERAASDNQESAKQLLKEMAQLQAEHSVLHRQLRSQEVLDQQQQEVNEAVKELKAQVKLEIQSSLQELQSRVAADPVEDAEPEHSLRAQLRSLQEDYPFSASSPSPQEHRGSILDEQWRGEALREKLRQQEDRLKVQLHQSLSRQAAVLSRGRQHTEGSLHSLRRRLAALDDVVCYGATEPLCPSPHSSGSRTSLTPEKCSLRPGQDCTEETAAIL